MPRILCVDDDPGVLAATQEILEDVGYDVVGVRNAEAARTVVGRGGVDLVVCDYRLPGASGLELLEQLHEDGVSVPFVVVTGYASIDHAVTTIKAGATDYLTKPVRPGQLEVVVSQALEYERLRRQNEVLKGKVSQLNAERSVIGDSAAFRQVTELVETAAPTRATVLLQGESGTGKELLARMLHELSGRGDEAFVSVNCAAMPEHLVESMLFGHEKGAFTGATKRMPGAFERAHRGTLLLDEISEMRTDLQAKLLRALQEQEFERIGGTSPIRVDVRVIATTNRDLKADVEEGRFRADLFYRLNVLPVHVPALRDRPDDIPVLANYFAGRYAKEAGRPTPTLEAPVISALQSHDWPGNVRELSHAIQRAVILAGDGPIQSTHLSVSAGGGAAAQAAVGSEDDDGPVLTGLDIGEAEKVLIAAALKRTQGNRTQAAKLLGISVRTLRTKLNRPA
ncbi:MAG: sigma-54 dependent transcriptional regulator [Gemmatimonadota bacterium]